MSERGDDEQVAAGQAMQLQSIGLTLLGVILSVAVTVGFSLPGAWWVGLLGVSGQWSCSSSSSASGRPRVAVPSLASPHG